MNFQLAGEVNDVEIEQQLLQQIKGRRLRANGGGGTKGDHAARFEGVESDVNERSGGNGWARPGRESGAAGLGPRLARSGPSPKRYRRMLLT